MKIWILGRDGLLGKELARQCDDQKIAKVATNREEADITDFKKLTQVAEKEKVTHIVNCAAYTDVDKAESQPEIAYQVNADGPEHLAIVARQCGARLIHISTDYVFDGQKRQPYGESDACKPTGVYAHSKWVGENRLLEHFPSACILRTSWLFGKGGKNFISSLLSRFATNEEVRVVTDQTGRPTYCRDLAEAVLSLLCHSGIYHFANRGEASRFRIAEELLKKAQERGIKMACRTLIPVLSKEFPTPAPRPAYSVLATEKIERVLGKPPRPWTDVVDEYLR